MFKTEYKKFYKRKLFFVQIIDNHKTHLDTHKNKLYK